jgi:hypothetical protein
MRQMSTDKAERSFRYRMPPCFHLTVRLCGLLSSSEHEFYLISIFDIRSLHASVLVSQTSSGSGTRRNTAYCTVGPMAVDVFIRQPTSFDSHSYTMFCNKRRHRATAELRELWLLRYAKEAPRDNSTIFWKIRDLSPTGRPFHLRDRLQSLYMSSFDMSPWSGISSVSTRSWTPAMSTSVVSQLTRWRT